ncbi:MAG: MFS transporter [Eubacteriaceae bacterium]|nr:MFS transporter [Eubacteriaceae bacterium]
MDNEKEIERETVAKAGAQAEIKPETPTAGGKKLAVAILSLSLLTVMAGAAVAPALNVIKEYFKGTDQLLVQMIISIPAIFIVLTSLVFSALCRKFKTKHLLMAGLVLYTAGGCAAGAFSSIYLVLAARALVGIGVGIVMPMSTGLLSFYFAKDRQEILMGYSSAMNQMGGAVATLLSGVLAAVTWRAGFLVYLMGLISIVLCLRFMPNGRMQKEEHTGVQENEYAAGRPDRSATKKPESKGVFRRNYPYIIAIFLLMFTFFIYPANFAIETAKTGIIPEKYVAVIMASMDIVAFFGGLAFVHIKKSVGNMTAFLAPVLFLTGYLLLAFTAGWAGTLAGSWLIGFANGAGIPYIISGASMKNGKAAATTVMPLISAALYLA